MTIDLTGTLRRQVAEELATVDEDLQGDDRREFARQRIFALLDQLSFDGDGEGPVDLTLAE